MSDTASLKKFYQTQIQKREAEINEKIQNIKRLEAQRFELNSNGTPSTIHSLKAQRRAPCSPRNLLLCGRSRQGNGQDQSAGEAIP